MVKIIYVDQIYIIVLSFYTKYHFGLEIHDAVFWENDGKVVIWQQWRRPCVTVYTHIELIHTT